MESGAADVIRQRPEGIHPHGPGEVADDRARPQNSCKASDNFSNRSVGNPEQHQVGRGERLERDERRAEEVRAPARRFPVGGPYAGD
jgi:hypothetical protein